jgi:hypothetical protein
MFVLANNLLSRLSPLGVYCWHIDLRVSPAMTGYTHSYTPTRLSPLSITSCLQPLMSTVGNILRRPTTGNRQSIIPSQTS